MALDISKITTVLTGTGSKKPDSLKTRENTEVRTGEEGKKQEGFSGLSKGQIFRGQITNISPSEVTIELENGESITAKYHNLSDLAIGDGAKFKVLSDTNHSILIKTLSSPNSSVENAVLKALDASLLPFSEKNEELITALLDNELPVNKEMINLMLKHSFKNPGLSMSNLVLMHKTGLPITAETAEIFEAYSEVTPKLNEKISDSFRYLLDMVSDLTNKGKTEEASDFTKNLLSVLNEKIAPDVFLSPSEKTVEMKIDCLLLFNKDLKAILNADEKATFTPLSASDEALPLLPETKLSSIFTEQDLLELFKLFENSNTDASSIQKLISGEMVITDFINLVETLPPSEKEKPGSLPPILKNFMEELKLSKEDSVIKEILPENVPLSELTERAIAGLNSDSISSEQKALLLSSPQLKNILISLLNEKINIRPEDLVKPGALSEHYSEVSRLISKLSGLIEKAGLPEKASEPLNSAKNQVTFLNTLSHYYGYAELPLKLTNQTATGELYVYSNKKRKKEKGDDNLSVLLHLDLTHLGPMNIRLELNGASISTKFYLEDEEGAKLISLNLDELDKALERQGLKSDSQVVGKAAKNEDKNENGRYNLVRDFLPSEISKKHFTRYSFDVRA